MTLPVVDTWDLKGEKHGPDYKVGPRCANPTCSRYAEHAHHMVRRSQLKGDYAWVWIDGTVYANLCGLCVQCHDEITGRVGGHRAAIRLVDDSFYWSGIEQKPSGEIAYLPLAPLDPQPPTPESLAERSSHDEPESEDTPCPFCGREGEKRRRRSVRVGRRRRKSWGIEVPDDHEDGASVLDSFVEELAPMLDVDPNDDGRYSPAARYFVVMPALFYAQQNRPAFLRSIIGKD